MVTLKHRLTEIKIFFDYKKRMSSATSALNINKQYTTLWLIGGHDANPDFDPLHSTAVTNVDLRVLGGVEINKNIISKGNIYGLSLCAPKIYTEVITNKNRDPDIVIAPEGNVIIKPELGNVIIDSDALINGNVISQSVIAQNNLCSLRLFTEYITNKDDYPDLIIAPEGNLILYAEFGNILLTSDTNVYQNLNVIGNIISQNSICSANLFVDLIRNKSGTDITFDPIGNVVISSNILGENLYLSGNETINDIYVKGQIKYPGGPNALVGDVLTYTISGWAAQTPSGVGILSMNGLTSSSQFLTTGTSGTSFNIVSSGSTHTFNIPNASSISTGLVNTGSQTFSGQKTMASPIFTGSPSMSSITNSGTVTIPTGTYTLVGDTLTQTLTNKILTLPMISSISNTGTITLPTLTTVLVGRNTTDTLTNKTIDSSSNTVTADKLRSASTTISISTAQAPVSGQVLTAINSTSASWQTPSGGGSGITSLNGLSALSQTFATGTFGTDFNINSVTPTHTFNIPSASPTARGLVTTTTQTFNGDKTFNGNVTIGTSGQKILWTGGIIIGNTRTSVLGGSLSMAVGFGASCKSAGSVSIGAKSYVNRNTKSVALGYGATVNTSSIYTGSIAIGYNSSITLDSRTSIAIGQSATCNRLGQIMIGKSARSLTSYCAFGIAIGYNATVNGHTYSFAYGAISLGPNSASNGLGCIAIGSGASSVGTGTIPQGSIAIGLNASVSASDRSIAIGSSASAGKTNCVVVGSQASAKTNYTGSIGSVCVGYKATTQIQYSIVIGPKSGGFGSVGGGSYTPDTSKGSVVIGYKAGVNCKNRIGNIVIGYNVGSGVGSLGKIPGYGSNPLGCYNIVMGTGSNTGAWDRGMVNIGWGATSGGGGGRSYDVVIGRNVSSTHNQSVVIGLSASTTQDNHFRLGGANITLLSCQVGLTVTSDQRDKANVESFDHGLDFITQLNPVKFKFDCRANYPENNFVPDGSKKDHTPRIGFLAQEVKMCQTMGNCEYLNIVTDEATEQVCANINNELITGNISTYSMNLSHLHPIYVNAFKDLLKISKDQANVISDLLQQNAIQANTISDLVSRVTALENSYV